MINGAKTGGHLKKLDLTKSLLKPEQMFMGYKALKIVKNPPPSKRHVVQSFLKQVRCNVWVISWTFTLHTCRMVLSF